MSSINFQSLFSRVTTEFNLRKVQSIDSKNFNKTIFQISDQQSRDKNYEKGLEYLRTYIASLQAKANSLIEELNNIYENMLSDSLFRRADTKDTAKLLNVLPNADQDTCSSSIGLYNPKDLEITPYDQNVRYYSYNPLFGSRALDLQNYYNLGANTDTSISRAYYESTQGLHHELGASAFSTLSYLWMWDLDRINASYATTKEAFIDEGGVLHVGPSDPRATQANINAGIVTVDYSLAIAGGGNPNSLQVNVTALQPNRQVFLPDDDVVTKEVDLLKIDFEKESALSGWVTGFYDHSGSVKGGGAGLDSFWEGINQWGIDKTPDIDDPTSSAGYNSRSSLSFGNTKVVTYNGVVYAPHSTYLFEPELINEHFDNPVSVGGGVITGTQTPGWTYTGPSTISWIPNTDPSFYENAGDSDNPASYGGALQISGTGGASITLSTPAYNLNEFEDIKTSARSYYEIMGTLHGDGCIHPAWYATVILGGVPQATYPDYSGHDLWYTHQTPDSAMQFFSSMNPVGNANDSIQFEFRQDYANNNASKWQIDDVYMRAEGWSRDEIISPKIDASEMENLFIDFADKIDTGSDLNGIDRKDIYYSFDSDDDGNGTWVLLGSRGATTTNGQWEDNTFEIPCAAGQDNVRVKFVFDTRSSYNPNNPELNRVNTNGAKDNAHNGWNIDDLRIYGNKVDPTDFYYYRQDLDSEFVTGTGPRVSSSSSAISGLEGIQTTVSRTDSDSTKLTTNYIAIENSSTDKIDFVIPNTITSLANNSMINFNVNSANNTNALGIAHQTINTMPSGQLYDAVTINSFNSATNTITFENPYLSSSLTNSDKITINGYTYDILSVLGSTLTLDTTNVLEESTSNIVSVPLSSLGISNQITAGVIKTRPRTVPDNRELYSDITAYSTPSNGTNGSFNFVSNIINDSSYSISSIPSGIQSDDPYAYYSNLNGVRVNNNNSGAPNYEWNVSIGGMSDSTFIVEDRPMSYVEISNLSLSPSAVSANITFDHFGNSISTDQIRNLEIVTASGAIVSSHDLNSFVTTSSSSYSLSLNTLELNVLKNGGKVRFSSGAENNEFRASSDKDIVIWDISNLEIEETASPSQTFTSEFTTGNYNITESNTKFSFDYSAVDDSSLTNVSRKVYMHTSTDGGTTFGTPVEILNVGLQTGGSPTFLSTGPISMQTGTTVKFTFETEFTVPAGETVTPKNDLFQIKNLKMSRYEGDGYNQSESPNAQYDSQRPNISFDSRRSNLQGKYTVVNGRTQITNTDYPMFANTFLTYIEQDANVSNSKMTETYVDWVGDNDMPPARVVDAITGKVKSQIDSNFILRNDGLGQLYDTNVNGGVQNFFVDDAMAINTGRLTKTTNVDDINSNSTGWVNAQDLGSNKIWLPYLSGTKYNESNGTYKEQTILGKRTFLTDSVDPNASLTISSNDDAYLYVNGFNVKSTAYAQSGSGAPIDMIDASDYSVNEYVMINGSIQRIANKVGTGNNTLILSPGGENYNLGTFGDVTSGEPITVYHVDLPLDTSGNAITVLGTTGTNKIQLTSLNDISLGLPIVINGNTYTITAMDSTTNTITVAPANLISNPIPNNSIVYFGISDKGPASNPNASGTSSIETNSMSAPITYNVAPLLRVGFNTIGFKASEDRGTGDGVSITSSNIHAIGDTNGPNGINTDSRWAVKVQEKGYDGLLSIKNSTLNPYSDYLSTEEIVDLFKSEVKEKKELTVKFINQDQNGIGKLSHIQSIDVTVTGEPLIGTFKTTNYSSEQLIDGLVTTQLTKGYIRGVAQDGNGDAIVFDPTSTNDPDNPTTTPTNNTTGLRYTTGNDGTADISVFLDADDNLVNDATLMVKIDYYEDGNGDGIIDGDFNNNGIIDDGETGILKTKYIGMQDLRQNLASNSKGNSAGGAIGSGSNAIVDRYKYAEVNISSSIPLGATSLTVPVADITKFSIGDDIQIINGSNNQTVQITSINSATGQITFQPYTGTGLAFGTSGVTKVTTNKALSDVDSEYAQKMYSGSYKFDVDANTSVHSMNISATNGRSGGADVTGNQNKLTKRLKEVLDNPEYTDVLKYGLLDEVYVSATASDNRGDQVVGKLVLNWDSQRKRLGLIQGSFSAVYKS